MDGEIEGINTDDNKTLAQRPDDWKIKLSAAFDEDEIFSHYLYILGIFYVVYVIVETSFDAKDNGTSVDDEFRVATVTLMKDSF